MTVNKDMTISEVLSVCGPDVAPIFMSFGMHCLGCPISRGETVEQAAQAHGIDLEEMLTALNDFADAR